MKLDRIQIKNFRSIKDETIHFNDNCLILLGKNEAGKSNILKAIAAVFDEYKVSNKDKRKRTDNEKIDKSDYFIRAIIKLDKTELDKISFEFKKRFLGVDKIIFKNGLTLEEIILKLFHELLFTIQIEDGKTSSVSYWSPPIFLTTLEKPLKLNGNNFSYDNGTDFNITTNLFGIVKEVYNKTPIKCHYWSYSDDYLLPNSININSFISNASSCKGLENIFFLCNREHIKEEFDSAFLEDGDYSNLLDQVSNKVTTTFQKIWKDFNTTSIQLLPNGDEILIKVVNKAKYSFEDRSDGFKKFISILLMLSTKSRANKISKNDVILIDEPDQSLYPTSAQYLRDELIEISKKSIVIYSTHSQYMIDPNCLERHLIIEKKDDVTSIRTETTNAPYSNDELLRRAIGSSIFECLQNKNIIFEGWLDKELFSKYCEFNKKTKDFTNIGKTYLAGISGVESLVSLMIVANKKFIIVADSDETSNNRRIEFEKNYLQYKNCWIGYSDIVENISTMEDFVTESFITEQIKNFGINDFKYDSKKNAIFNIEKATNKNKENKQAIKNLIMKNITKEMISPDYVSFILALNEKINKL